ncbi:MAG: hypothetical protein AB1938_18765 [Myxococcota bacterium]
MRLGALLAVLLPSLARAHAGLEADVARLTKALDEAPSAALYLRRAEKLRLLGRTDEALADVDRARGRGASLLLVSEARGLCFAAKGEPAKAVAELDGFLGGGGVSQDALRTRAAMLRRLGRGAEAVLDARRAVELYPEPDVVLELARLEESLGRPADAARTLEQGLARLGGAVTLRLELIALYRRTGQHGLALAHARTAASALEVKTQWQLLAAEILLDLGRGSEARAELEAVIAQLDARLARRPNALQLEARGRALELLARTTKQAKEAAR